MKKTIAILFVAVALVTGCNANKTNNVAPQKEYVSELKALGYNDENINLFESKLNEENINTLTEYDYIENISDLLNNSEFDEEKLRDYLDYYNNTNNVSDIVKIVNNGIKYKYTEKLSGIINHKYYISSNLDRYMKYDSSDVNKIITYVNSNRDKKYYDGATDADISKGYLVLVNKYYGLGINYKNENMVRMDTKYSTNSSSYLDSEAYEYFKKMVDAAAEEGLYFKNQSSYRSYATQSAIYNGYISEHGQKWADKWSAKPGYSEHQTGLALDVIATSDKSYTTFGETKEYQWLKENCYKYGFIQRYQDGKQDITGYGSEPWHYRYVGVDAATYIYENDITFEEYYAYFVANN